MKSRLKWLPRKRIFLLICFVLTALSLSQIGLFIMFSTKMSDDVLHSSQASNNLKSNFIVGRRAESTNDPVHRQDQRTGVFSAPIIKSTVEEAMKMFLSICSQHEVTILSVDKHVLNKLAKVASVMMSQLCPLFCFQKVTTFAVFQELFEQSESSFFEDLLAHGFRRMTIEGPDPKQTNVTRRLHHVIGKGDLVVHLTTFNHRRGNFWWHGKLDVINNEKSLRRLFPALNRNDFQFAVEQGAYNKFHIRPMQVEESIIYLPRTVAAFLGQMETSVFLPCNHTTAQRFRDAYGWSTSQPSESFQNAAMKALSGAKKVLDGIGVPFWLSSGTCLGFFRQCDLIPYSRDVDIGIFIRDYDPRIVETFVRREFKLKHKLGKIEDSLELSFVIAGIKLDIFFFYEETNHTWNGGLQTKSGKKFKYIFPKFTLCWTEFLDLKVRVPCQTQRYVEANYGPKWFEPVLDWDWKSSPSNVRKNGRWSLDEWPEVIQQFDVD